MRNMSLSPVPGYCPWEEEGVISYQSYQMFVSDDIVTSPDGMTLSVPGGQAWSHRSSVIIPHDVSVSSPESWCHHSGPCSQEWGGSLSDYQPRDLFEKLYLYLTMPPPPEHPGHWSPDQYQGPLCCLCLMKMSPREWWIIHNNDPCGVFARIEHK